MPAYPNVMPGLVPGIRVFIRGASVDGRVKPGHDVFALRGGSGSIGYAGAAPASQASQQARARARTRPI
jgi:hypothetical protein